MTLTQAATIICAYNLDVYWKTHLDNFKMGTAEVFVMDNFGKIGVAPINKPRLADIDQVESLIEAVQDYIKRNQSGFTTIHLDQIKNTKLTG